MTQPTSGPNVEIREHVYDLDTRTGRATPVGEPEPTPVQDAEAKPERRESWYAKQERRSREAAEQAEPVRLRSRKADRERARVERLERQLADTREQFVHAEEREREAARAWATAVGGSDPASVSRAVEEREAAAAAVERLRHDVEAFEHGLEAAREKLAERERTDIGGEELDEFTARVEAYWSRLSGTLRVACELGPELEALRREAYQRLGRDHPLHTEGQYLLVPLREIATRAQAMLDSSLLDLRRLTS